MAKYHYDEAGNLAASFFISMLAILLVPLTLTTAASLNASKYDDYWRPYESLMLARATRRNDERMPMQALC
jgi:preprotein translocase subunit Sec63